MPTGLIAVPPVTSCLSLSVKQTNMGASTLDPALPTSIEGRLIEEIG